MLHHPPVAWRCIQGKAKAEGAHAAPWVITARRVRWAHVQVIHHCHFFNFDRELAVFQHRGSAGFPPTSARAFGGSTGCFENTLDVVERQRNFGCLCAASRHSRQREERKGGLHLGSDRDSNPATPTLRTKTRCQSQLVESQLH